MNNELGKAYFVDKDSSKRKKNDFYPTAPIATYSLVKNYDLPKRILEPAAGRGWISRELIECGFDVISKDLFPYDDLLTPVEYNQDFLKSEKDPYISGMITNPPFGGGMPLKFVKKSIEMYDFTCIFSRLTFLESKSRYKFLKDNPFTQMIVLSTRINCDEKYFYETKRQCGGMIAYAWYIWDKRSIYKNRICFIDPVEYLDEFITLRGERYLQTKETSI